MNKSKKSSDKVDEIEENSKRKLEYKSNIDAFKSSLKSSDEHEEEISKRLDSYRAKEKIKEESEASSPVISKKSSPEYVKPTTISADENRLLEMMRRDADIKSKSLELMNQDLTKEKYEKEIEAKRHEMDAQVSRVEALNANETIKRMKDQILKYAQEVNIYRVEIEALKRQVDIADGNAKTKEEDAKRIQEDYERKIKLIEERHAVQSVKQESRELNELKRENRLLKDAHEEEIRIKFEEIDYLTKRCEKLEAENVSLRVGNKAARDADAKAKKYEEEVHSLRMRLREQLQSKEAAPVTGSNYNNWTKEQLVRELLCIDRAIERFTKENESLMFENKKQAAEIQELNALLYKESQKIDDFKNKIVKESGSVLVAEDDKDLHVKNVKDLGANHVISKKELDEIRERLFKAEKARLDLEQEMTMKEVEYKSEIENLRLQKLESERKLIGMDSALKTQIIENDKLKGDYSNSLNKINTEKEDINLKLKWYMENQGIIEKDSDALQQKDIRIEQLKEEIKSIQAKDGGRKRMATLEKQVKDLQGALAAKNPDSIPLMLNAVKPSFEEEEEYRILKEQNESLKKALQEKDAEFDKRIRTLRIEIDKMKDKYESTKTAGLPEGVKDKRIQDLERQLQETKDYYIDRLKKLEQKTGTAGIINEKKAQIKDEMAYLKEIERLKKENESLKRTPSKFDKNGKEIKINSKEKSTDFIGTINKLMNEDYIFCLCVMLKDTLKIKGMLEKKAKFADCIKDVEELIDHIEKASVSFKSTVFFSKITDKCLELSKILQGEDNAKRDNSIPHQKLTAIEKLIRDEINLKIKQKKDKDETNVDLVVVDIEDKIESQPAPRRKVKEDEDEYWSDFSDDVFTCEVNEESKAQEVLLSLQRWIYASNLESDLKSKYPKTSIITLDEFKDCLSSAGYYCELIDLQTLLKKLEIKDDKGINYKEFLTNISEKNAAWWKETLKNNGFDLNIKGKTGMHRRTKLKESAKSISTPATLPKDIKKPSPSSPDKDNSNEERKLPNKLPNKLPTIVPSKPENKKDINKGPTNNDDSFDNSLIRDDSPVPSPSKPSKPGILISGKSEQQIKDLEATIKEKNKAIIDMEKEISALRAQIKLPSSATSKESSDLAKENRDLNRRLKESEDKYQRDKKKYEDLIKENINTPIAGDFLLLQKKIDYLERNIYEREKDTQKEIMRSSLNSKDKLEINRLKNQIETERNYYSQIIDKKNNEIRVFRDELDVMLQELDELKKRREYK